MEKLTEVVIALLMIVNGEIKEHRIQESMSDCLKGKRIASRNLSISSNEIGRAHVELQSRLHLVCRLLLEKKKKNKNTKTKTKNKNTKSTLKSMKTQLTTY